MPRHLLVKPNSAALITAAAMILGGCAATGDDYVVGVRPTIVNHPVLGPITIKEQDLLGPDADQNGVRDEIDKTLRQTFPEGEARERGESYALQVTKAMLAGTTGRAPTAIEIQAYAMARDCLGAAEADAPDLIYAQTTRTKSRASAMQTWSESAEAQRSANLATSTTETTPGSETILCRP